MSDEFESGVFSREGAWHGHGTVVAGALTTVEAFEKSGQNWPGSRGIRKNLLRSWNRSVRKNLGGKFTPTFP